MKSGATPKSPRRRWVRLLQWALVLLPVCALGCRHILFCGPILPSQPLPATKMIDVHCHAAGIGAGDSGCFVSKALQDNFKFGLYLKTFGVTEAELKAQGDGLIMKRMSGQIAASHHVGWAVVLALDGVVNAQGELDLAQTEVYIPNEFVAREVAKYTNLLFGASVNPYRKDALERLDWAKAHGAKLVKWLPPIQEIDPADEKLIPFYQKLVQLQLPLLTHTGFEHSFTRSHDELADPDRLRLPLRLGVTVIAAHAASTGTYQGERATDRLARLMPLYPNLYTDISSLTQINKKGYFPEALRRAEFQGRLLYGTDFPINNIPVLASAWLFPLRLTCRQMWTISHIKNPWDRDVALKQALGVPTDLWLRADALIKPLPAVGADKK